MSPVIPFDIFALIIDIIAENRDTDLLKGLALVNHSFLQICSKHLFATVELHEPDSTRRKYATSINGFVKLLKSKPDVVMHIRKLTYRIGLGAIECKRYPLYSDEYDLLLPIPNLLRTIPQLNCLTIAPEHSHEKDWNTLDYSMTSALLHLMHLPTINHIEISFIRNFPLSNLTSSDNLHRLNISHLFDVEGEDGSLENVQSEKMLRDFRALHSSPVTTKLLHAKLQDGRPAFNFMDLRLLSMTFIEPEDEQNIRYILQNAELPEKLHLSVDYHCSIVGLLSPTAHILKVLGLTVRYRSSVCSGVCEELEAMAGHNMLEVLSFEVKVSGFESEDFIGSVFQKVEEILVKPGWSALRQVYFKVSCSYGIIKSQYEALKSLPDKYLSHLPKLESVAFDYSAEGVVSPKCKVRSCFLIGNSLGHSFYNVIDYN